MSELKAGDTTTFEVAGQVLIVEPMPYGRLKKVIKIVLEVSKTIDMKNIQEDVLTIVPKIIDGYVDQLVPLLFDQTKHSFMTQEWIENNMTIPTTKKVIIAAIEVNGLGDFFTKTVKAPAPNAVPVDSGTTPATL